MVSGPPKLLSAIEPATCAALQALLCDLDDTLTTAGKLHAGAFDALWRAHAAGLAVVVVTGRPAGWADHLARMWPVHGVIGENGGLYFRHVDGRMRRHFAYGEAERAASRSRLQAIGEEILQRVPGCRIAADQPYREFDLAIDFAEDAGPLALEEALRIQQIFQSRGAQARISSIHVNGWFGEFDKLATAARYLERELGLDAAASRRGVAFIGDSPNDEPMFSFFPQAIGVANLRRFDELLSVWPSYLTAAAGGAGFAEAVDTILARRGSGGGER